MRRGDLGFKALKDAVRLHRAVASAVRHCEPLLVAGDYTIGWNSAWPQSERDELSSGLPVQQSFIRHHTAGTTLQRWVERLPPRTVRCRGPRQLVGEPANILLHRGDCAILLERDGQYVRRVCDNPALLERLIRTARDLGRTLRVPAIELLETGVAGLHCTRESVMEGIPYKQADPSSLEPAYHEFLAQCQRQAAEAGEPYGRPEAVAEVLEHWPLPDWLSLALNRERASVIGLLSAAPMVHAHGDAHLNNLILLRSGGTGLIDLERSDTLPFFFDALYALHDPAPAGTYLRKRYLAGAFDESLERIWQAAGRSWEPDQRLLYLLAIGIAHGLRSLFQDKSVPSKARRIRNFTRALEDLARARADRLR